MGRFVSFTLNGKPVRVYVEDNEILLNTLRYKLGIKSAKYGCGIGECGACTVLVDGRAVLSCLTLTTEVEGKEVLTAEGLGTPERLHTIQKAFAEHAAVQCGYCTPGFVMTAAALLKENPNPSEDEVRDYIRGNYCRCTGYYNIVKAILAAAKELSGKA